MIFVKLFFAPLVAVASRVVSHREALHDELFVLAGAERKTLWHKNFPIYAQDPFGGSVEVTRLTGGEAISTIAFFAPKGSFIRMSADKLMPWYLKWFGTPGERAEYMLGTIYRWVTENPTTAFTAAAATAVTGGLAYYWYRSRGRPSERVVDDTVLHAINRTAKEIEQKDPNLNATMAVSELQAARGAALQAAAEDAEKMCTFGLDSMCEGTVCQARLDEIIDYGYPQILEVDVLKKYITQGGAKNIDLNDQEQLKKITVQATGVCSWRAEGIKHRKNEVFIDVIENVNILMSTKRERLRADVSGEILVNCKLSGMPECKFGMNDKLLMSAAARARSSDKGIALDDYRFHQCVRLSKFDVDREITFIPPDEPFQLMTYRITENIESPFKLLPNVKVLGRSRLELSLQVTAMYDRNIEATNVRIDFPCPKNTAKAHIPNTAHGKARFDPAQGAVVWRIRRFPGRHEYNLLAEAGVKLSEHLLGCGCAFVVMIPTQIVGRHCRLT
ncbi:unnamed protein product [Durusdinium trenchii]|uniref:MHD domain-containing protein n=1 Tax=Durusdinium trenchii TaxID=1381693 RepID=A0ABP0IJS9_9DINO